MRGMKGFKYKRGRNSLKGLETTSLDHFSVWYKIDYLFISSAKIACNTVFKLVLGLKLVIVIF